MPDDFRLFAEPTTDQDPAHQPLIWCRVELDEAAAVVSKPLPPDPSLREEIAAIVEIARAGRLEAANKLLGAHDSLADSPEWQQHLDRCHAADRAALHNVRGAGAVGSHEEIAAKIRQDLAADRVTPAELKAAAAHTQLRNSPLARRYRCDHRTLVRAIKEMHTN
jgi:hypothetical protein